MSAIQPHSQFRTSETALDRDIAKGTTAEVTLPVRYTEAPGAIVENPFLILRVRATHDWRLLARVRVTAGARGEPVAAGSVVVTVQEIDAT